MALDERGQISRIPVAQSPHIQKHPSASSDRVRSALFVASGRLARARDSGRCPRGPVRPAMATLLTHCTPDWSVSPAGRPRGQQRESVLSEES